VSIPEKVLATVKPASELIAPIKYSNQYFLPNAKMFIGYVSSLPKEHFHIFIFASAGQSQLDNVHVAITNRKSSFVNGELFRQNSHPPPPTSASTATSATWGNRWVCHVSRFNLH
jgi:hypothetical protein